jgi:hypothetical protein
MSPKRACLTLSVCALLALPAVTGARPQNDGRDSAQPVATLPASLNGGTDGATDENGEASSPCASDTGSVWYRYDAKHTIRLVARLRADGDLDATVSVYERLRSQQTFLTCDVSDTHGRAAVGFTARKGESYLIRVARRDESVAGDFHLNLSQARVHALPGPPLPPGGVAGSLDRVGNTAQPWSVFLRAGAHYRMALEQRGGACLTATLYAPGTVDSGRPPLMHLTCDHDYALMTLHPGQSGRFTIMVNARIDVRGPQRYHLQVATGDPDDIAPGLLLGNLSEVRGTLDGAGIDIVDLYRFDVTARSKLFLRLAARRRSDFDLELLDPLGNRLGCACDGSGDQSMVKGLRPGDYYVAVRAKNGTAGTYHLTRASRTITIDHLKLQKTTLAPGVPERFSVRVAPAVSGLVVITLEQLDPLAGWQFVRTLHARAVDGRATVSFVPPSVGHWRASARYESTPTDAASHTGFSSLLVVNPRVLG